MVDAVVLSVIVVVDFIGGTVVVFIVDTVVDLTPTVESGTVGEWLLSCFVEVEELDDSVVS